MRAGKPYLIFSIISSSYWTELNQNYDMRYHDYDSLGTVRFIDIHTCFTFFFAELAVSKNITVYNIAQTPKQIVQ